MIFIILYIKTVKHVNIIKSYVFYIYKEYLNLTDSGIQTND